MPGLMPLAPLTMPATFVSYAVVLSFNSPGWSSSMTSTDPLGIESPASLKGSAKSMPPVMVSTGTLTVPVGLMTRR